jgi:hypothetical protein
MTQTKRRMTTMSERYTMLPPPPMTYAQYMSAIMWRDRFTEEYHRARAKKPFKTRAELELNSVYCDSLKSMIEEFNEKISFYRAHST